MAELWTPDRINRANAEVADDTLIEHVAHGRRLTEELRRLDHRLDCVYVGERAPEVHGIRPGRWHIRRRNDPPTPHSYLPIETPDGHYKEPSFQIIEELKRNDLWSKEGMARLTEGQQRKREAQERADKLTSEQIADNAAETFRAAKRVSGEGGFTKRLWGKGK